jgi:hypothetical protein
MKGRGDNLEQITQLSGGLISELESICTLISLPESRNSNCVVVNGSLGVSPPSADERDEKSGLTTVTSISYTTNLKNYLGDEKETIKKPPLKHVNSPFKTKKPCEVPSLPAGREHHDATLIVKNHTTEIIEERMDVVSPKLDSHAEANRPSEESLPLHDHGHVRVVASSTIAPLSILKDKESIIKKMLVKDKDDIEQGKAKEELQNSFIWRAYRHKGNKNNLSSQKLENCPCGSGFAFRWLWKFLGPYKFPLLLFVIIYFLFVTCGAAFLLKKSFVIPGLRTQVTRLKANVDALEFQVDRFTNQVDELAANIQNLTGQVDRLESENNRFAAENDILTANNAEYALLNSQLEARNQEYKALNVALNTTVENYRFLNDQLHRENDHYKSLNDQLNQTVLMFSSEVSSLQEVRDNLTSSVSSFQNLTGFLQLEVGSISQKNTALNETVAMLQVIKNALEANNEYYRQLNANLSTVVSFLNTTSNFIGETFDSIVSYLSSTIIVNRNLVLNQLYLTMRQIVSNWRCGIADTFLEPWVDDTTSPIGINSYLDVLSYVNTTVFSQLCISLSDFETFLGNKFAFLMVPSDISLSQMSSGLNAYTTATLKYYFPGEGQRGLTAVNWDKANFKCSNLPVTLRFSLYGQH